jgi:hypothetical protein
LTEVSTAVIIGNCMVTEGTRRLNARVIGGVSGALLAVSACGGAAGGIKEIIVGTPVMPGCATLASFEQPVGIDGKVVQHNSLTQEDSVVSESIVGVHCANGETAVFLAELKKPLLDDYTVTNVIDGPSQTLRGVLPRTDFYDRNGTRYSFDISGFDRLNMPGSYGANGTNGSADPCGNLADPGIPRESEGKNLEAVIKTCYAIGKHPRKPTTTYAALVETGRGAEGLGRREIAAVEINPAGRQMVVLVDDQKRKHTVNVVNGKFPNTPRRDVLFRKRPAMKAQRRQGS